AEADQADVRRRPGGLRRSGRRAAAGGQRAVPRAGPDGPDPVRPDGRSGGRRWQRLDARSRGDRAEPRGDGQRTAPAGRAVGPIPGPGAQPTGRAGDPTTVVCGATSRTTTALAPTTAWSPTTTGPSTLAPVPIMAWAPM